MNALVFSVYISPRRDHLLVGLDSVFPSLSREYAIQW